MNNVVLTKDQEEACLKFKSFLLSDAKEFYLFGAAGCGKSFLLNHFLSTALKEYKQISKVLGIKPIDYSLYMTAPTNKAVAVLKESLNAANLNKRNVTLCTIYTLFNISVGEDYSTGKTYLRIPKTYAYYENGLIIIDECSMLPKQMIEIINKNTRNCKIVYVGDNYQLAPVNEKPYWNSTPEEYTAVLKTPVRNANSQALIDLCNQMRQTVDTLQFGKIKLVPGAIEQCNDEQAKQWLMNADYSNCRVLSYTNHKAIQYIKWIEQTKNNPNFIRENAYYLNNSAYWVRDTFACYPDELLKITEFKEEPYIWDRGSQPDYSCKVINAAITVEGRERGDFIIALDPEELKRAITLAASRKDWVDYFNLKKQIMDLRLPYASTIHKAQGSTFKEVFIDLSSFNACQDPVVAARLLYVAISRAQEKIFFYGKLPKRFGEVVCSQ